MKDEDSKLELIRRSMDESLGSAPKLGPAGAGVLRAFVMWRFGWSPMAAERAVERMIERGRVRYTGDGCWRIE